MVAKDGAPGDPAQVRTGGRHDRDPQTGRGASLRRVEDFVTRAGPVVRWSGRSRGHRACCDRPASRAAPGHGAADARSDHRT